MKKIYTACFALLLFCLPANAQTQTNLSTPEDIAIAFYKVGNIQPDIEQWIRNTAPFENTPPAKRPSVMLEEKQRIALQYNDFDIKKDSLQLQTKAKLKLEIKDETDDHNNLIQKYFLNVNFLHGEDVFYFPFEHAKRNYALMPFGLENILRSEISKDRYDYLDGNLRPNDVYNFIINMVGRSAVTSRPFEIDGVNLWVLKTDIASSEIWDKKGSLFWEYTAPWYVSPQLKELNDIYELKPKTGNNGIEKPFIVEVE